MEGRLYLILILVLLCAGLSLAQQGEKVGGRIIVRLIQLEHADAKYLASVLKPFFSPEGSIVPVNSFFSSSLFYTALIQSAFIAPC